MSGWYIPTVHLGQYWFCSMCGSPYCPDSFDQQMADELNAGQATWVWCDGCTTRNMRRRLNEIEQELAELGQGDHVD